MTADLTAFIFARGGSKGLPRKNIKSFAGKPLIGWAIEHAFASSAITRVIVSTDSEEIGSVAKSFGAEVPFLRPNDLSDDHAPEILAWRHALKFLKDTEGKMPEYLVSVPPTSPLRIPSDIDACIEEAWSSGADIVLSVSEAHRSPWFNMVKQGKEGNYALVNETPAGFPPARRQDVPKVYDVATVAYVAKANYVMTHSDLFSGKVSAVVLPRCRTIDIDDQFDFDLAEFVMARRSINS